MSERLVDVKNLQVDFKIEEGWFTAVKNVSFHIEAGQVLGLVGESGSGKSVMTSAILKDISPGLSLLDGEILYRGVDILKLSQGGLNKLRGANISMIYQEPMAALNPSVKVGKQIEEVFELHRPEIQNIREKQRH